MYVCLYSFVGLHIAVANEIIFVLAHATSFVFLNEVSNVSAVRMDIGRREMSSFSVTGGHVSLSNGQVGRKLNRLIVKGRGSTVAGQWTYNHYVLNDLSLFRTFHWRRNVFPVSSR